MAAPGEELHVAAGNAKLVNLRICAPSSTKSPAMCRVFEKTRSPKYEDERMRRERLGSVCDVFLSDATVSKEEKGHHSKLRLTSTSSRLMKELESRCSLSKGLGPDSAI